MTDVSEETIARRPGREARSAYSPDRANSSTVRMIEKVA